MEYYLLTSSHKESSAPEREALHSRHVAWVESGGMGVVSVLAGAPTLTDNGIAGNFFVLEAKSLADAKAFAEGDPFVVGHCVETSDLRQLAEFSPNDMSTPLSPRLTPN